MKIRQDKCLHDLQRSSFIYSFTGKLETVRLHTEDSVVRAAASVYSPKLCQTSVQCTPTDKNHQTLSLCLTRYYLHDHVYCQTQ